MSSPFSTLERRLIVAAIVAAHVFLVAQVILATSGPAPKTPSALDYIILSLYIVELQVAISLIALWGAIGRVPASIRLPVVLMACTLMTIHAGSSSLIGVIFQGALLTWIAVPLSYCRLRGMRTILEGEPIVELKRQFRLWHLLAAMVGFACLFAYWKVQPLRPMDLNTSTSPIGLVLLAVWSFPTALGALLAVWATLLRDAGPLRWAILLTGSLAIPAAICAGLILCFKPVETAPLWFLFWMTALNAPWLCVTLAVIRECGYVVVFPARKGMMIDSAPQLEPPAEHPLAEQETTKEDGPES